MTSAPATRADAVVLAALAASAAGLAAGLLLDASGHDRLGAAACAAVAVAGGLEVVTSLAASVRRRRPGVDLLALLAITACAATGEVVAAAVVALMVWTGAELESWARARARRDLAGLLAGAPRHAVVVTPAGTQVVDADDVRPGDVVVVASGATVPADGALLDGESWVDESALTGEPRPVRHGRGEELRSGAVNIGAPCSIRASRPAADSAYRTIVRLVDEATTAGSPARARADAAALVFSAAAISLAVVAGVAAGAARAAAVLVVATPCPLLLGVPIATAGGVAAAARRGVVVRGGTPLERLRAVRTVLFDRTGTLTSPVLSVVDVQGCDGVPPREVLHWAASVESRSEHVLGTAIVAAARREQLVLSAPLDAEEHAGAGISGVVEGHRVRVGTLQLVAAGDAWAEAVQRRAAGHERSAVFLGVDDRVVGAVLLGHALRPDARPTVRALRRGGVRSVEVVTGAPDASPAQLEALLGVDAVHIGRSPAGKVDDVAQARRRGGVAFVGDGINDAPALAAADVGIALAGHGAAVASSAADVVVVIDRLDRVAEVFDVARRTQRVLLQSAGLGIALSTAAMAVAAGGLLPAATGAVVQELIDVLAVASALRAARSAPRPQLTPTAAEAGARAHEEHTAVDAVVEQLRVAAEALGAGATPAALEAARAAHAALVQTVLPHEAREEASLYPGVDEALGGIEPTASLRHGHAEMAAQVVRLGTLLEESSTGAADVAELRHLLYGLHAVLELHTAQEEERYGALVADARRGEQAPRPFGPSPAGGQSV